ncbi:MAG: NUDIX hydrolase [Actinomycetota bacterium]
MRKQKKEIVQAAGGIVYRRRPDGELEVVLVHRPRHDDWSLPKGKVERGETIHKAAVREVEEETGLRVQRGTGIAQLSYRNGNGRPKHVDYFYMTPVGGELTPNDEVDELRWVTLDEALRLLTYDRDREMLAAVLPNAPPL